MSSQYYNQLGKYKSAQYKAHHLRRKARMTKLRRMARRLLSRGNRAPRQTLFVSTGELKGMDTDLSDTNIVATTTTNDDMIVVNLIEPGNGSYNRVGRKIRMKSLFLKGQLNMQVANTTVPGSTSSATFRMIVVYDAQPSGVLPIFSTIFGTTVQNGGEGSQVLDSLRFDNTDRFRVLRDKRFSLNPGASATSTEGVLYKRNFEMYIPLKGIETLYSGQSSPCTIADISSGALYVIFRSDINNASIATVSVGSSSFARLRYHD